MTTRLVSDLHIDINDTSSFGFLMDVNTLLIAGDIAGGSEKEIRFLKNVSEYVDNVYAIAGNHLGYDNPSKALYYMYGVDTILETKESAIKNIKNNIPDNVKYLDNEYVDLGNYILFAGTMYSDYELNGNKVDNIWAGINTLNDFRYVYTKDKKEKRRVTPEDYVKWFKSFIRKLNKCYKETDKDIIVMTHFAPSAKSIASKYIEEPELNASYCSDLDEYIKKHYRIKYWLHGHTHECFDYFINQCHVICQPYGYANYEGKMAPMEYFGYKLF